MIVSYTKRNEDCNKLNNEGIWDLDYSCFSSILNGFRSIKRNKFLITFE